MPYNSKELLKDATGRPIPQEYDQIADTFTPVTRKQFYGSSTDAKPTKVDAGASFIEIDTKAVYIYDGARWEVL
jgi:hypothetical protein